MDKEKELWLESINAKAFPEPIKYTYMFPGYRGAFNLSERYVHETPLDELKETYRQNERHALSAIQAEHDRAVSTCMLCKSAAATACKYSIAWRIVDAMRKKRQETTEREGCKLQEA
ncbi:MAG: hypothetical protein HFH49_05765 [Lachnospiraceae bacterium]|nr:hypothetical protein [Lachnospiraceae bacterium]